MSRKSSYGQGHSALCMWACLAGFLLTLAGCEDEPVQRDYPKIRTLEVTNITGNGATFIAEVIQEGTAPIAEHGFTWSLFTPDMTSDERIYLGSFSGTGRFEAEISTALKEGLTYEVCAFVKAGDYTVYGDKVKFMSLGSGAPEIIDFMPKSAGWGDTVTITGRKFSHLNSTNKIIIENQECSPFVSSDTLLKFAIPPTITKPLNSISVSIQGNVATTVYELIFIPPTVNGFNPVAGYWGDTVTFTGRCLTYFGQQLSDGMILNDNLLCKVVRVSATSLSFVIPGQLNSVTSPVSLSYKVFRFSFPQSLTLLPPEAGSFSPTEGTWGTLVTLYGQFNPVRERNSILFGDKPAQVISVSRDSAVVRVPDDLGEYVTTVRYQSEPFTCEFPGTFALKRPEITGFSPTAGYVGEIVTIKGRYLRKSAPSVEIGGSQAIIKSVNDSVITCYVPGDVYGECDVIVSLMGNTVVAPGKFNSTNHVITGITPVIPAFGETVTVRGTNFRSGTLIFLGPYQITTESQTENEIKFIVPLWLPYQPGSLTAKYTNRDSYYSPESSFSNPDNFQVKDFTLTGVTPVSGVAGDIITISGADFGNPDVAFGSVPGEILESTSSVITVRVPPLSSGDHTINVTIGGRTHAYPVKYTHSGAWRQLADLPFLYENACVFDFGEEVYIATADISGSYKREIFRFNASATGFDKLPVNYTSEILDPISCTLNGLGYIIGQRGTPVMSIGFEVFNPDALTWKELAQYPGTSWANPCIFADDSVIYAGCGKLNTHSDHIFYSDFWKYSPKTNQWTQLADFPYYCSSTNQIFINGRLLMAPHNRLNGLPFLMEYQPSTDTWTQVEVNTDDLDYYGLNDFRNGARASVMLNGKWYIGFGDWYQTHCHVCYEYTNPVINNRFYSFDPATNTWKTIRNVAAPARTFPMAFSAGGKFYIGGSQIYHYYDFWEYDPLLDQ